MLCVVLAPPLSCVTKCKLLNLSVPHLQNGVGSFLPGVLQRLDEQCMRKLMQTLGILLGR